MYSAPEYRACGVKPRWTPIKTVNPIDCDECFAEQVETQGASGPRAVAKARRSVAGTVLNLCRIHEDLWKTLDDSR